MAKDMKVRNLESTGSQITIGRDYSAKIDGDGMFRVRDDSGRWSKYGVNKFQILEDVDSQMLRYGKTTAKAEVVAEAVGLSTLWVILTTTGSNVCVNCRTIEDAALFLTAVERNFPAIKWSSGLKASEDLHYSTYGENTCYNMSTKWDEGQQITVGSVEYFNSIDFEVVAFGSVKDRLGIKTSDVECKAPYTTKSAETPLSGFEFEELSLLSTDDLDKYIEEFIKSTEIDKVEAPKIKTEKEHDKMKKTHTLREILVNQGVPDKLINQMNEFRKQFANPDMPESVKARIPKPTQLYEGGELWTQCITAILAGKHILLSGGKATGKNTLTQSLAFAFQRPIWDMSFHSNIGKDEIVGSETFRDGNVVFNPGMAYTCALYGGIGVLDEINMAKDSAIAVLNSMLDDRRVIDVPGYERLNLHPATTFIGTMNYGYAGTRALNEALASRFVIPEVREMTGTEITDLLTKKFPNTITGVLKYFSGVFIDLQAKAHNAEISTASVDLRGIISALDMIQYGMNPNQAMTSNVVNKSFEAFERKIVQDVVNSRIPSSWTSANVFTSDKEIVIDMSGVK